MAVRLERLLTEKPVPSSPRTVEPVLGLDAREPAAEVEPVTVDAPDVPDKPAGVTTPSFDLRAELRVEMDSLRDQLDVAFEEVISRTERLEGRLATLLERPEPPTEIVLDERFMLLARTIQSLIDAERARPTVDLDGVERAVLHLAEMIEANTSPPDSGADAASTVEARLAKLDDAIERLPGRLQRLEVPIEIDQSTIDAQLAAMRAAIEAGLAEGQDQIGQGITGVRRVLRTMQERPVPIDIRAIEEVAHRAALPNGADIASLRREVEALLEAVRQQDKGIAEIRTTLDWIKDRLLQR